MTEYKQLELSFKDSKDSGKKNSSSRLELKAGLILAAGTLTMSSLAYLMAYVSAYQ